MTLESKYYIRARSNATEMADKLTEIRNAISAPGIRGVCLYFHGGLSGESYVRDELGVRLMDKFFKHNFESTPLYSSSDGSGLYPIFVVYDASFWGSVGEVVADTLSKVIIQNLESNAELGRLVKKVKTWMEAKRGAKMKSAMDDQQFWAQQLFQSTSYKAVASSEEMALDLLSDGASELERIAEEWSKDPDLCDDWMDGYQVNEAGNSKGLIPLVYYAAKVAVRSAARHVVGNNHEFVPTIVEEAILTLRYIKDIAPIHWGNVYTHAKECWDAGKSGAALMNLLGEIKEHKGGKFVIHAQSHSAGSIAIGELIAAMAQNSHWPRLDEIVTVVPAINQVRYSETYLKYPGHYKRQTAYILSENDEHSDSLFGLYPASLLYFVSGVAEKTDCHDKMLLIEHHLNSKRRPYASSGYRAKQGMHGGDQDAAHQIWKICGVRNTSTNDKNEFKYCPDKDSRHESTKYPDETTELARCVYDHFKQVTSN